MAPDGNFIANMLRGTVTGATIGFVSNIVVRSNCFNFAGKYI